MNYLKTLSAFIAIIFYTGSAVVHSEDKAPGKHDYIAQNVDFKTHDGYPMTGRLVLPQSGSLRAVVIYVQTAEGATADMKRPLGVGKTFNYHDLYREKLTAMNIGFFSYEGRGIQLGDSPPRYEKIDWEVYNTSTLDNKVDDILSAVSAVRSQDGLNDVPIILMGGSEGTLLASQAASKAPDKIDGLALYGVMSHNMRETFRFIMTGGSFLRYRVIDQNGDGVITKTEWANVVKRDDFEQTDINKDGKFTVLDFEVINKKFVDAIDNNDYETLQAWAKTSAGMSVPEGWFEDHFAHREIWSFLSQLDIPVGCFQGEADGMTSAAAVRELESKAKKAGLTKMEFHYFEGLDHSLTIGQYFVNGQLPEGHRAIFSFIDRIAPNHDPKSITKD